MTPQFTTEIWKQIHDYEQYEISNMGNVRTRTRYGYKPKKKWVDAKGYERITMCIEYKQKTMTVHRLIALAFIPNPLNFPMVNHKDEVKDNNKVDNLEWCNNKYNANYGTRNARMAASLRTNKPRAKKVVQMDRWGNEVCVFDSITDAAIYTKSSRSRISGCCNEAPNCITANSYKWKFYEYAI